MVMTSYDHGHEAPVITVLVEQYPIDVPNTAEKLWELFSSAREKADEATIARLATCEFGNSDSSIQRELHASYMKCFYTLQTVETRRIEIVGARFLLGSSNKHGLDWRDVWGQVVVTLV
jgi:hypothetical protein